MAWGNGFRGVRGWPRIFSGSRESGWGAMGKVGFPTAARSNRQKLSDSPVNMTLAVNATVPAAGRSDVSNSNRWTFVAALVARRLAWIWITAARRRSLRRRLRRRWQCVDWLSVGLDSAPDTLRNPEINGLRPVTPRPGAPGCRFRRTESRPPRGVPHHRSETSIVDRPPPRRRRYHFPREGGAPEEACSGP